MTDLKERIAGLSPEKRALLQMRLMGGSPSALADRTIPKRGVDGPFALSFAQQRLWFLDQWESGDPTYNVPGAYRLAGSLNVEALGKALNEVVRRHEALRTTFRALEGEPAQVISPELALELPVVDLEGLPKVEREAEAGRMATEEARRPFDLVEGPLIRAKLVRLSEQEHILVLVMHHIVSDGWSMGVLFRELSVLYEAFRMGEPSPLDALSIQYGDFAAWQRGWLQGEVLEGQLSYWRERLSGSPALLDLPADRPRPAMQGYRGARVRFALSEELSESLSAMSRREGVTLFMVLLAAFKVLLYRYTAQEDIVVGTPIANRNRVEIEGLIGFFVNTLALRTDLSGNPTFRELLSRMREVCLGAYGHQDLPFERLVEELRPERDLSYSPLFQVMFVLQNASREALSLRGLRVRRLEVESGTARFDLTLSIVEETDGLSGTLEYNTDLFDASTISRMSDHYRRLLEGAVSDPDEPIGLLPLLTDAERDRVVLEWNDTPADYPRDRCIHDLFEAQAERTPDALAVVFEDRGLTYGELNERANRLAHYLRALGVGPEVPVGICMERSIEMVVGLLGILKAGGAWVPMDPSYPRERLAFMLEDTQVGVLLAQERILEVLPEHEAHVVCLDAHRDAIRQERAENPIHKTTPENLAYVIYTSGSTGKPKGVMIEHGSVINNICWMRRTFCLDEHERYLLKSPIGFDISVHEVFVPLLIGARLFITEPGRQHDAAFLMDQIVDHEITVLHIVPSLLQALMEDERFGGVSSLRHSFCGGEALPVDLKDRFLSSGNAQIHNMYGPTETCMIVTHWTCLPGNDPSIVPIGRPMSNVQAYLLDDNLQPVPVGVPGELHIGGVCLARGYLNLPDQTEQKFVPNPFSGIKGSRLYKTGDYGRYRADGAIEFLGRGDSQVKIRGQRVEAGEIEACIKDHQAVRETVVALKGERTGDERLIAYVVPRQGKVIQSQEIRQFIEARLPPYMVPSAFVFLDDLPLTTHGKVDYKALPVPEMKRPELENIFEPPQTPIEKVLAGIWAELLGIEQVGIHDHFFELGGHSLLAARVVSRIRKTLRVELPLRSLFETPTVGAISRAIVANEAEPGRTEKIARVLLRIEGMSSEEVRGALEERRKAREDA